MSHKTCRSIFHQEQFYKTVIYYVLTKYGRAKRYDKRQKPAVYIRKQPVGP